jgi:hypothetical protein
MCTEKTVIYLFADQLKDRAVARIRQAERLPPGAELQHALKNAAQLRSCAAMKRLLVPDLPGIAAGANGGSDVGN